MSLARPHLRDEASVADDICAIADRRDVGAFAALFRFYAPRLKTYMLRAGASSSEAEELAQETLAQIWRRATTFDRSRATPSAWIFTIARNLRIDARRRAPPGDLHAAFSSDVAEPLSPDMIYGAEEQERRVAAALAELSPEHLDVLRMAYFDDLSQTQIAAKLDLPLGTVKSRVRLGIARLRALLDDAS